MKQQIDNVTKLSKMIDDDFDNEYDITFFGGEPLLKMSNIIQFDNYIAKTINVKNKFVQTNGILITEDVKKQLDDNNIHIGISCDGCNDKNKQYIENLYKNNIVIMQPKMMVDGYNVKNMNKSIQYFFNIAVENELKNFYIDVSFVKDDVWSKESLLILKEQLQQLKEFIKLVYRTFGFVLGIGFVDRVIQNIVYGKRKFICFAGKNGFSITPSGIIYPCSRFYSSDKYKLFDINTNEFYINTINFIKNNNKTENEKCNSCSISKYCNQGCYFIQLEKEKIIDGFCKVMKLSFKMVTELYSEMKREFDIDIMDRGRFIK